MEKAAKINHVQEDTHKIAGLVKHVDTRADVPIDIQMNIFTMKAWKLQKQINKSRRLKKK